MTTSNAVTVAPQWEVSTSGWAIMKEQANVFIRSGFLPSSIKTPEQAMTIMFKGRELGIPPMQAFSHINVIQGKPAISSELMLALIYRSYPGAKIDFKKLESDGCQIMAGRPGQKQVLIKFEKADAESAGLLGKENWRKYPRAMFRSRAISEMARALFPECLMGCSYVPEELDPDLAVNEDGQVQTPPPAGKVIDIPAKEPEPIVPEGPILYDGATPELKNVLQEAAKRIGITEIPDLKVLSKHCVGTDMRELAQKVKEWNEGRLIEASKI